MNVKYIKRIVKHQEEYVFDADRGELVVRGTRLPASAMKRNGPSIAPRKGKSGFLGLPFVGRRNGKRGTFWWTVPAAGGYFGGYETGEAMAYAFMKVVREKSRENFGSYIITHIAESFMIRFEEEGGKEMNSRGTDKFDDGFDSLRGQYIGFFNSIGKFLVSAAGSNAAYLDSIDSAALTHKANAGLKFDSRAYLDGLLD